MKSNKGGFCGFEPKAKDGYDTGFSAENRRQHDFSKAPESKRGLV